jgi:cystathionine beta-synthase
MFVGYTSGAAMQAINQLVEEDYFNKNSKVVVMFPDHGSRYMSKIYSEEWMEEQGFFDSNHELQQHIEYINETAKK